MKGSVLRTGSLLFLTIVFTVGLTFATVELPYHVDRLLQNTIAAPGGDSHADAVARLKTELFMAHYHVRVIGYVGFLLLVALIVLGFSTKRTGLAALGAIGVMLPVFAQFAGVMFFLAGLGVFNTLWLPVLDISYEVQNWGMVINAPNDLLRWLLDAVGVHSMWPTTLFFIGAGVLIFLLGVYAWLAARVRGAAMVESGVYRISRHPQYLGWIVWTYGVYLLLQQMHYPRRSWAIGASLPWLISTMVIIGVAMVEELNMRKRHGEVYEEYRESAPFLFPLPRFVERLFTAPVRLLFKKDQPGRKREVAVVVAVYTALLVGTSVLLYAGGLESTLARLASAETRAVRMRELVGHVANETNWRRQHQLMGQLVAFGEPAVEPLVELLEREDEALRVLAAEALADLPSQRAIPALIAALDDPDDNVRYRANHALRVIGSREAIPHLVPLLDDPELYIRVDVMQTLALLGSDVVLERARLALANPEFWVRTGVVSALGALGSPAAIPVLANQLHDESAQVRREVVIALLRIGCREAKPLLEQLLGDDDFEVRVYAAEALKRLGIGSG
jgi:protein-S-isoprenylcysteine O-methyltransferase Ste14